MNKASSLFVLILLGSLVADAVAQTNPPRGGQHSGGQQSGQGSGSYNPNYPVPGQQGGNYQAGMQGGGQQGGQQQGGYQGGQQQGGYQGGQQQGGYQGGQQQGGYQGGQQQGGYQGGQQQGGYQGGYNPQQPQNPYGQGRIISQQLLQSLRSYETLRLSDALRLSMNESRDLEVLSITLTAQALRNQATVDVLSRGRSVVVPQLLRRQMSQLRLQLPTLSRLDDLEIIASDEVILDNIQVEVRSSIPQVVRPMSGQLLTIQVPQVIRNSEVPVKQLVKQQLGLTLDGVVIEKMAIVAQAVRGAASVQLEMNGRIMSEVKSVSTVARAMPLLMNSGIAADGNLRVIVRGEVMIREISIRVGQVRAW